MNPLFIFVLFCILAVLAIANLQKPQRTPDYNNLHTFEKQILEIFVESEEQYVTIYNIYNEMPFQRNEVKFYLRSLVKKNILGKVNEKIFFITNIGKKVLLGAE